MTTIHAHSHSHAHTSTANTRAKCLHKRKYSTDFVCRMRGVHSPTAPRATKYHDNSHKEEWKKWKREEEKKNARRKQRARTKLLSNVIFGRLCPSERFVFSIDSAVLRTSAFLFLHTFDFQSEYELRATKNQWKQKKKKNRKEKHIELKEWSTHSEWILRVFFSLGRTRILRAKNKLKHLKVLPPKKTN